MKTMYQPLLPTQQERTRARSVLLSNIQQKPDMIARALSAHPEKTLLMLWDATVVREAARSLLEAGMADTVYRASISGGHRPARDLFKEELLSATVQH